MPKTDIYGGKSPRELPLYTATEVARVVRIPAATLRDWLRGRSYPMGSGAPLIRAADPEHGRLSFANLVEVHMLSALRGKHVRERYLQCIERDENGLAARLFPLTRSDGSNTRLVVIDPACRFGRPVLASAYIETAVVVDRFFAGDSIAVLAADFGIDTTAIQEAIRFESHLRAA